MRTKVSVIIVNWNGAAFLDRCLTALMDQTVQAHEVIVVDNASSDNSLEIVRGFPSVRILDLDFNSGFAQGNNLGASAVSAESEWIALLNPDAFPDPRWLEELLIAAAEHPEFAIFGSKLLNAARPSVLDGTGDGYHVSGRAWRMHHGSLASPQADMEREIFSPCAAAALYRSDAFHAVAGFDEAYFCYMEDVDLGFRMRLLGFRCRYAPKSIAYHVGSGTTDGQHSYFSRYHGHRNLVWTFVKNMPGALFWILLPVHLLLNFYSVILFTVLGQGKMIYRSKKDALLGLPAMWRRRRQIQSERTATISEIWRVLDKRLILKFMK